MALGLLWAMEGSGSMVQRLYAAWRRKKSEERRG